MAQAMGHILPAEYRWTRTEAQHSQKALSAKH